MEASSNRNQPRISPYELASDSIRSKLKSPDSLTIHDFGLPKARGVLAARPFRKSDYVLYYHGELKTDWEDPGEWDEYLFEIRAGTRTSPSFWIDASRQDGSFGRLINDNHVNPNVKPKLIHVDNTPHIAFFAIRDIAIGEEITYNYDVKGDAKYWWRHQVSGCTDHHRL